MKRLSLINILLLTFLKLIPALESNVKSHCLKVHNIFAYPNLGSTLQYRLIEVYETCLLLKQIQRDPCVQLWLYSELRKQWVQTLTDDDVQDFFDKNLMAKQEFLYSNDINNFLELSSNLTQLSGAEKITLFYVFNCDEYNYYYMDRAYALAIAEKLHYLQKVENHDVIFNCLKYDDYYRMHWFCQIVQEKLPKTHFVFLTNVLAFDKVFDGKTREYLMDTLKNPRHNRYGNLRCNGKVSILFWFHDKSDKSDKVDSFLSAIFANKYPTVATLTVKGFFAENDTVFPSVLVTADNQSLLIESRDFINDRILNFTKTSKKIIKINILRRKDYHPNRYEFLREFSDGELINVVIDKHISKSPKQEGRNTIIIWPEDFHEPIFISVLIERINQLLC